VLLPLSDSGKATNKGATESGVDNPKLLVVGLDTRDLRALKVRQKRKARVFKQFFGWLGLLADTFPLLGGDRGFLRKFGSHSVMIAKPLDRYSQGRASRFRSDLGPIL